MNIDKTKLLTLWYENEAGDKLPISGVMEAPEGYIYQHSMFPWQLTYTILRSVIKAEVEACPHNPEDIKKIYGYVGGIEGRECQRCRGTQIKTAEESWSEKWNAHGVREVYTGRSTWSEDLVLAMANSGDYTLGEAILVAGNCCEKCLNSLAHKYGLTWGYPEYGDEWKASKTECEFCKNESIR